MSLKIGNSQTISSQPFVASEKSETEKLKSDTAAENEAAIAFLANNSSARINNSDFNRTYAVEQLFDKNKE